MDSNGTVRPLPPSHKTAIHEPDQPPLADHAPAEFPADALEKSMAAWAQAGKFDKILEQMPTASAHK